MSIIRYSPFDEFRRLEDEISKIFRDATVPVDASRTYTLPINITEDDDGYVIIANIPGYDKDEIELEATSQYLQINAKHDEKKEEKDDNYVVREISHTNYRRRISFDKPVDTSKAKTTMKNGVLTINMPKMEEAKSVKLIPETIE